MNKPRHSSSSAPALARNKGPRQVAASAKKPAAPAVYRPQTPKVLQSKQSKASTPAETRQLPSAPPVYRPQPPARCLQKKSAPAQPKTAHTAKPAAPARVQKKPARPVATNAAQLKGTVQRFAWAIHDSRDMKRSEIVNQNLTRASRRYTHTETTTDPDREGTPSRPFLNPGEAIHLHAHGHDEALAGFSASSLGVELSRKFDMEDLAGRVIVLHSCNTGQADFGKQLLEMLVSLGITEQVSLTGTTVYAPTNFLVVEDDGLSYVARTGVQDSELRVTERRDKLQNIGEGWRGWRVTMNGAVEEITNPGRGVIDVLNSQEAVKQTRFKPPKPKKKPQYGYYDDPRRRLTVWEQNLLDASIATGQYPPKRR